MAEALKGIYIFAGPQGAGKSTIAGRVAEVDADLYFNPDLETAKFLADHPDAPYDLVSSEIWKQMVRLLEEAIEKDKAYVFETTLRGDTIPGLLHRAASLGKELKLWFVALESPEMHIERVEQRVRGGGHGVAGEVIRDSYDRGRLHLIELLPLLKELRVLDNSTHTDRPEEIPEYRLILAMADGRISETCALEAVPEWAKPIMAAARQCDAQAQQPSQKHQK